ncbi:cytochrome ubiquinol oxidase subunit I [Actinoallomurus oryzae]|uniref:Cytochrome ubiquinol oxidase subunit I n=1 Tax=Actinoallomurus oryzae TaxID=502180 RepID=A0ABP8Q0U8_9ACTN
MHVFAAASPADLLAAREQMALSLGWHIILACFGVGMPVLTVFAEWRGVRTDDEDYVRLAHQWARAMGVLFAVGAVSGTILSFEMGLLWPGLMATYGQVIGLPFALEGFAFFIEAIFLGIYLYAWGRLSPRRHVLTGLPVCVAGVASAVFVVAANAWMNQPRGFDLVNGSVTHVRPWRALFNPAMPWQVVHMVLAAFMVTGFGIASVYAAGMLRGRRDRYHRIGLLLPFVAAAVVTLPQIVIGDTLARLLATQQPAKLAAIEGLNHTGSHRPISLGGLYLGGRIRYALRIPDGLSLLVGYRPGTVVKGLDTVPPADRPPVNPVHLGFQVMVAIGFGLLVLSAWQAWSWWRRRDLPRSRWFLRFCAVAGIASVVALEAGWVTTEVGRQPWIVWHHQRTADAVNPAPGLWVGLVAVLVVYTVLTVAAVYVLVRLRSRPVAAPQEGWTEEYEP